MSVNRFSPEKFYDFKIVDDKNQIEVLIRRHIEPLFAFGSGGLRSLTFVATGNLCYNLNASQNPLMVLPLHHSVY